MQVISVKSVWIKPTYIYTMRVLLSLSLSVGMQMNVLAQNGTFVPKITQHNKFSNLIIGTKF